MDGNLKDEKFLDRLEEQVQVEYETRMEAIKLLREVAAGSAANGKGSARRGRRGTDLSIELPEPDGSAGDQLDEQEASRRKPARGSDGVSDFDKRLNREMAIKAAHQGRKKRRGPPLSEAEKKKRKAAYMREYLAKRRGGRAGLGRGKESEDGLPPEQFDKLLHRGPVSAGGTGEDN